MNSPEVRARRAAYMREYRAAHKETMRAKGVEKTKALKNTDPATYRAFREAANARTRKYAHANQDELRRHAKAINHRYTPERGRALRETYHYPLKGAQRRSRTLGLPITITMDWYLGRVEQGCSATGIAFVTERGQHKSPWYPHIDRIDPTKGYVVENCRLVCQCFNTAKLSWGDEDVLRMAVALVAKSRNADE